MKKIITLVAALLISVSVVSAQGIALGLTGGLTMIQGPDGLTNDISEGGAGFSSAPHFGVKGKLSLPLIPLSITGQVLYSNFTGDGEVSDVSVTSVETEMSLLILGVGAEYSFVPGPVSPYVAFDLFYSNTGDQEVKETTAGVTKTNTFDGTSRTGIGIGAGFEFGLLPMIDVDIAAKYNINNLIGKEDGEDTFSTINLSATVFFGF